MGMIFGKTGSAEPVYDVLYRRSSDHTRGVVVVPYEIRKYGERFAAETSWITASDADDNDRPFSILAKYIGVFGTPQNEGQVPIAMTAPVMKQQQQHENGNNNDSEGPVPIAMTAPVMTKTISTNTTTKKTMMFVLPDEYKTISSIPKPTNPNVTIVEIPPSSGAVYKYSGSMQDNHAYDCAIKLGQQLRADGASTVSDDYVTNHYQYWGYTPPFTLPMFRRNEIWIDLSETEIDTIVNKGQTPIVTKAN